VREESLNPPESAGPGCSGLGQKGSNMGVLARVHRAAKVILSREELPVDPPRSRQASRDSFLAWLLRPEALDEDPQAPRTRKRSFLFWLLGREGLPLDPVEPGRRGGFLGLLFERESLSTENPDRTGD